MDILHIASGDIWAGAEAQVAMLAEAQASEGHRVRVATFAGGELSERLSEGGVETRVIDERMGAVHVVRVLREWLRSDPPVVVHAHGYKEAILGFLASVGLKVARVRTQHGVPELPFGTRGAMMKLYDAADRFLGRAFRVHWIAVSDPIEQSLRQDFSPRVHRVANSVSIRPTHRAPDELRASLGLSDHPGPILLYAGRLEPIKGPDVLIEAFSLVLGNHPDATLLMAGAGSSEEMLRTQIAGRDLGDRVQLLGSRRDVFDLMALADMLVLPSRGEGMPTVILEALACGCPVVATAVGAISEATRDGALATLVEPERADALARACMDLIDDPARRVEVAASGMAEISERYSPKRAATETEAVYIAACGEKGLRIGGNT